MLLARLPLACIALAEAEALFKELPMTGEAREVSSQLKSLKSMLSSVRRRRTPPAPDQAERLYDAVMGVARKVLALHEQAYGRPVRAPEVVAVVAAVVGTGGLAVGATLVMTLASKMVPVALVAWAMLMVLAGRAMCARRFRTHELELRALVSEIETLVDQRMP